MFLSTTQFGKVDIITTVVNLLGPLACLDLSDAVFRYALDKAEDKKDIFSTGLYYTFLLSIVSLIIGFIISFFIPTYPVVLATFLLISNNFYSLISDFARSIGYVKEYAFAGVLSTLVIGISNILLLVVVKLGINGYLISMIIGPIAAMLYLSKATKLSRFCSKGGISKPTLNKMLKYSIPLIPNSLAWWLNSTSDRLFILWFLGASANGIYAMANKIPNMLNTVINIFFQSWQMSVVEEFNKPDGKKFITNVFNYFLSFIFFCGIGLVTFTRPIFRILLSSRYYSGWSLVPFFVLATIYTSLSSFVGTMYTAFKQTGPIMVTTAYGAVINIVVTVILVPLMGSVGAVIANIISFFIVSLIRTRFMVRRNKLDINYSKIILLHVLFIAISTVVLMDINDILTYVLGVIILILQLIFDSELKAAFKPIIKKLFKR